MKSENINLMRKKKTEKKTGEKIFLDIAKGGGVINMMDLDSGKLEELWNKIVGKALEEKASDIHLEPGRREFVMRFRVQGILEEITRLPMAYHELFAAFIKEMAGIPRDIRDLPQHGKYHYKTGADAKEEREFDLRISTFPTNWGEKIVIEIVYPDHIEQIMKKGFESIGLFPQDAVVLGQILKKPFGFVLFAGPPGSGKTTTVYGVLHHLMQTRERALNIVSLEERIEYLVEGINQTQVKPDAGFGYALALKMLARQDADVVTVDRLLKEPDARACVALAFMGKLLLMQIMAGETGEAVKKILDLGIEPYLVSAVLQGIVVQRLARRICESCKEEFEPDCRILSQFSPDSRVRRKEVKFYRGKGCSNCRGSGYKGRVGIFEVINTDEEILNLILSGSPPQRIRTTFEGRGITTLRQAAIQRAIMGDTTLEEALRVTYI